jgi:hypothetical protein
MPLDPSIIQPSAAVLQSIANPQPIPTVADLQAKQLALQNARLQSQASQQQIQSGALELQQKQQDIANQQAINSAMQTPGAFKVNPDGSYSYDRNVINQNLATSGKGYLAFKVNQSLDEQEKTQAALNKAKADATDAQNKVQQTAQDHQGMLGVTIADHLNDPDFARKQVQHEVVNGNITPQQAQQYTSMIDANPTPAGIKTLTDQLIGSSKAAKDFLTDRALKEQQTEDARQKGLESAAKIPGETATSAREQYQTVLPGLLKAVGDPVKYKTAYDALPALAKTVAPKPETNPTLGDVQNAGMTQAERQTAAHQTVEEQQRNRELGIQATRANAETALARFNQADRETKVFGSPFQTALTGANTQLQRIGEAQQMLASGTPEAQALAIPKVLTALVGGQGSGVRITQPELNSIGGARGVSGDLQAWMQKLGSGQKLTPDQSRQLQGVLADVQGLVSRKMDTATQTLQEIENAPDRESRIAATQKGRGILNTLAGGGGAPALPATLSASDVGKTFFSPKQNKVIKVTAVNPADPTQFKWQPAQ